MLTILGISIGVAAIIGLGALADGLEAGYNSFLTGSNADLVLSQPDAYDVSTSTVDEQIGTELAWISEISAISGMLQGLVQAEEIPFLFVYGYPEDSFVLERFFIVDGFGLTSREAHTSLGSPVLLGASAAEVLHKKPGETLRMNEKVFRIVGIYETGETLEDNGAVLFLKDAQDVLGRPRTVSLFYIQLKDQKFNDRVVNRIERRWPEFSISTTEAYADKQVMGDIMEGYVWGIAGLAILIGGVSMMNAQLMAVMERTGEIGVLRSVGWTKMRVLWMILRESLLVGLLGGILGIGIGWSLIRIFSGFAGFFGASTTNITIELLVRAFVVVIILGFIGGVYPAWRASRLQPVEALRYEGGTSSSKVRRFPFGGMAVQSLWQRLTRTLLTLGVIGMTVGGIIALQAIVLGVTDLMANMGADADIMVRQAGVSDTEFSALDERIGKKIASYSDVAHVSGLAFTGTILPDSGIVFIILGYAPNEFAIQRLNVVEGVRLTNNHQIMLGRMMAERLNRSAGDSIEVGGSRFKIVGIYETGAGWEEMGGVISLRDAQTFMGRPRKVPIFLVKVKQPDQARSVLDRINAEFPEVHASLTADFVEQMPDMNTVDALIGSITFLTVFVGGIGVMNTMLMSVLERTREIGVLRSLGWPRGRILTLIIKESLLFGLLGALVGIGMAFLLAAVLQQMPMIGGMLSPQWEWQIFLRAFAVAVSLALLGGLYPAFRATRLQPVEALRYE